MNLQEKKTLSIKHWAREDRPREKLHLKGPSSLSESELLAILIRSGTKTTSAVEISKLVYKSADNDLNKLAQLSIKNLMKHNGIGEAKAITIVAAMELGRRRKEKTMREREQLSTSNEVFNFIRADFEDLNHEECWVILLNRANRVIKKCKISEGGLHGTVVDPKIVYKTALEELASSIIMVHNHPSGNLSASTHDITLTKKLKKAGEMLEIQMLDHLIVAADCYLSFADKRLI